MNAEGVKEFDELKSSNTIEDVTIDSLNTDCLINIFELLSVQEKLKIELVNKRWNLVVKQSWSKMKELGQLKKILPFAYDDCNEDQKKKNLNFIINVINNCRNYLEKVKLECSCSRYLDYFTFLEKLTSDCINVTTLFIRDYGRIFADDNLKILFSKFKKLSSITLVECCISGSCFSVLNSDTIKELILIDCSFTPHSFICNFLSNLNSLSKFKFQDYNNPLRLSEAVDALTQSKCESVNEISLSSGRPIESFNLSILLSKQKNLSKLELNNITTNLGELKSSLFFEKLECLIIRFTDKTLTWDILRSLHYYTNLQTFNCHFLELDNNDLKVIVENINKNIKEILICYASYDESKYQLPSKIFSRLQNLESFTINVSFFNVGNIRNILIGLHQCKNLKNFNLSKLILNNSDFCKEFNLITDEDCCNLISNCLYLEKLEFFFCKKITNNLLKLASDIKVKRKDGHILKIICYNFDKTVKQDLKNSFPLISVELPSSS